MTRRSASAVVGLATGALLATASNAQPPESVNVDVAACLDLETREQQLECYEDRVEETLGTREADGSANEAATAADSSAPAPVADAPSESRQADRESRAVAERQRPGPVARTAREAPDNSADDIIATVASFRELEPDAYLIFLDNDQVWRQNQPKRYPLRVGAQVHLSPTRWGSSYRLTDPDAGSFIQVERVR